MSPLRVVWSARARASVLSAALYVEEESPAAARRLVIGILAAADGLSALPERGRHVPEDESGACREIFWKRYRIIYVVRDGEVLVVEVVHQRQQLTGRRLRAL